MGREISMTMDHAAGSHSCPSEYSPLPPSVTASTPPTHLNLALELLALLQRGVSVRLGLGGRGVDVGLGLVEILRYKSEGEDDMLSSSRDQQSAERARDIDVMRVEGYNDAAQDRITAHVVKPNKDENKSKQHDTADKGDK